MEKMDLIHENAFITIIAASGMTAKDGIPGVHLYTRGIEQPVADLTSDLKLIFPLPYDTLVAVDQRSAWARGAWT